MTDEELIARMRELDGWVMLGPHTHLAAADRIETLTKERDDYAHKLMQANNTYTEMHLEIERLSDNLAKAMEMLDESDRDYNRKTNNLIARHADRIKALIKERDQHWNSFVHWRKQADDLTGQLAAARQDADEAEAYAWELEQRLPTSEKLAAYRATLAEIKGGNDAKSDL